ncbi:MAG TPA: TonB-dependent receptor [Gammaproteobacteria bacterium]|jgi:outer membrane receptor protein involved in Fe transport
MTNETVFHLALLLLLGAVLPAHADDSTELGTITVTDTRAPVALGQLADNTTRVDAQTLSLISETHPAQVFSVVPGAWVTAGGGQESLMGLRSPLFTGQGACGAFLILEDGIPIQPAGFCNVNALFELNTEQAAAIEVIRGPGSVLYGSNALHGIVNVLTRAPDSLPKDDASLETGPHSYARVETSLGSWDGVSGFRISANAAHDGGFRADSGYDQQKLDLRYDRSEGALSGETLLAITNLNQKTAGYIYGISAYKDEATRDSNPTPGAYRDAQSLLLAQRWQKTLADGDELDFTPYARRNTQAFVQHYIPGEPVEDDADNSLGSQLAWRTHPAADTQLVYGLDGEYAHGTIMEYQSQAPLTSGPFERPQGLHYDYAADSRTLAGYADVNHAFTPQWIFDGGLRLEGVHYSYVNFVTAGDGQADGSPCALGTCLFNRPADRNDQFTNLMPKAGITWLATPDQSVYAKAGRGARAPQASELYSLQSGQEVADLHSETLDDYELGWRGQAGALAWDTDVYYMLKENFIFRDEEGFNVDDGRTRHRGLEFAGSYAFDPHWTLLLDGSYAVHSYAFTAQLSPTDTIAYGNDMKYAPRSLGALRLRWQPTAATTAEVEYQHVGGYFLDESDQHRYGGQDLLDLYLHQALGDGYTLSFKVLNAADVAYAERADFSFGNYRYFPGDGRQFFIGVQKAWE